MSSDKELVFDWYTPDVQKINDKLWTPENTEINNNLLYNFDSKIVNFSSFKNTFITKLRDTYSGIDLERKLQIYYAVKSKYLKTRIALFNEQFDKDMEHNKYISDTYDFSTNKEHVNKYFNDPVIEEYKTYKSNIKNIFDKLDTDYNNKIIRFETHIDKNRKLQIKPFTFNSYQEEHENITNKYNEKCLKFENKIKSIRDKMNYKTSRNMEFLLNNLSYDYKEHDIFVKECNEAISVIKISLSDLKDKYDTNIKMINVINIRVKIPPIFVL